MDFVGMATDIIGLARGIHDAVEQVKEFKSRIHRLDDRIQCLIPSLEVLTEMKEDRERIIELQTRDPPLRLPVFGQALTQLKEVIEHAGEFISKLQKLDSVKKFWRRNKITGQFDSFSERLDVLQNTVQFCVLIDMRKLMEKLVGEEKKVTDVLSTMKRNVTISKKGFKRRQQVDFEDAAKDSEELAKQIGTISEIQQKTSESLQRIGDGLDRLQIAANANTAGYSIEDVKLIKITELEIKGKVGKGSMGIVYKALYNKHEVAVKKLQPARGADVAEIKKVLKKEAENLKKFDSKNVVRLWGLCAEPGPDGNVTLMVVMEFMYNGTVKEVMQKLRKQEGNDRINWGRRVHMALGGALGLYRIHSMQPPMLHCAIDSSKFLVDRNYEMKISDVGFAHTRSTSGKDHVSRAISYYAPEHITDPNNKYNERSEMYSFGIVMWEIVTCNEPYAEYKSDDEKMQYILQNREMETIPTLKGLPKTFKKIVNRSRDRDRMIRPLAAEVVDTLQVLEGQMDDDDE